MWDEELRIALERHREGALVLGFGHVVEFFADALADLGEEGFEIETRCPTAEQAGHAAELVEVAHQRLAGAGVLDLDGHHTAVAGDGTMHLADGCRSHGFVVEFGETVSPRRAEVFGEHFVHGFGR